MKHDPLCPINSGPCCPWTGKCECQCICDLIARVRADERKATVRDAIEAVSAAVRAATQAVEGLRND